MNDYDCRQLHVMLDKINLFETNKIPLIYLIGDLEALINVLEEKDLDWQKKMRGEWWDLEQVYAMALYKEKKNFDKEDQIIISEAIENFKHLIKLKLNSNQ